MICPTTYSMQPIKHTLKVIILFILTPLLLQGQTPEVTFETISYGEGLYIPWDLEWMGENQILFTERNGLVKRLTLSAKETKTLFTFPQVAEELHSGLLGMALHPSWPDSTGVFVAYNYYDASFKIFMRLLRLDYDASNDTLTLTDTLYENITAGSSTTGGALISDPAGYLYLSVGDLDLGTVSQDSSSLNGKILRLSLDGSIPEDNPIEGSPIWSMGHRNPQGLALGKDGDFYSCEHGTFNNDELNIIQSGANYGWPFVSGVCPPNQQADCIEQNFADPILAWTPPIAPAGMAYYNSDFFPEWKNSLLLASLREEALVWVKLDSTSKTIQEQKIYLKEELGRIRSVMVNPEGHVFIATSNRDSRGIPRAGDDKIIGVFPQIVAIDEPLTSDIKWTYNPHKQEGNLFFDKTFRNIRYELIMLDGQILRNISITPRSNHANLSLNHLASGLYILRVYADEHIFITKIPSY